MIKNSTFGDGDSKQIKHAFSVLIDFQQRNTNNKQRDRNNYHMIYYKNTHLPGDFVEQI